jgi:hypothetical protein
MVAVDLELVGWLGQAEVHHAQWAKILFALQPLVGMVGTYVKKLKRPSPHFSACEGMQGSQD